MDEKDNDTPITIDYFLAYEHLNEYVSESVKQKHFIEAVVLIHTTIEMFLSSALEYATTTKSKIDHLKRTIVRNYRFINLARICYLLDLVDKSTLTDLLEINRVRNSLAHQNIKWKVTEREIERKCKKWLELSERIFHLSVDLHEKQESS